jgi:hypothetical protein
MSFDGSGTFTLAEAAFVYDTVISETAMNSNLSDIATGLTTVITKTGVTTPTANLPMGGYKHTGLGVGSAQNDGATLRQIQASAFCFVASDTGAANAYVIAPAPAIATYVAGQRFSFISANASTGASTVNVNALGVKAVEYQGVALTGAEIKAGSTIFIEYDGTAFQMLSPSNLDDSGGGPSKGTVPSTFYRTNAKVQNEDLTISNHSTTFSATNATNLLDKGTSDGFADDMNVRLTGSDLPNGWVIDTDYFVRDIASATLKLALTIGGSAVTISDDGSGTNTIFEAINASATGPITLKTGNTLTIPSGSRVAVY